MLTLDADSVSAQEAIGARLAAALQGACVIHLYGDLGAGKTTLVRGLLRGLGYRGAVKSPTYTLVEPYRVREQEILHLDLYRLADPAELEYLGLDDLAGTDAVWLIEWPERGGDLLPAVDLQVVIAYCGEGRQLALTAHSAAGTAVLAVLSGQKVPYARYVSRKTG